MVVIQVYFYTFIARNYNFYPQKFNFILRFERMMRLKTGLSLPLKMSFLIFSMVLNCVSIIILQFSETSISYRNLGTIEAFKDLPIALFSFISVGAINKIGTKRALAFVLAFVAVSCLVLPFANAFWVFKIWFALVGICFAIGKISVFGIMKSNVTEVQGFARIMNQVEASFMFGIFLVNTGFGWLILKFPTYWKFGFWLISLLTIINLILLKRTSIADLRLVGQQNIFRNVKSFFRKEFFIFFILLFSIVFVEQNFNTWLPSFYKKELNVSTFFALQFSAFMPLCAYLGRLCTAYVMKKYSIQTYFIFCVFVLVLLVFLAFIIPVWWAENSSILLVLFPVIGFFLSPLYPLLNSFFLGKVQRDLSNSFTAIILIFSAFGSSAGSLFTSSLFHYGWSHLYIAVILTVLIFIFILSLITFKHNVSN